MNSEGNCKNYRTNIKKTVEVVINLIEGVTEDEMKIIDAIVKDLSSVGSMSIEEKKAYISQRVVVL